jgi:hypothetical protein
MWIPPSMLEKSNLNYNRLRIFVIVMLCAVQLGCGTAPAEKTNPIPCQDARFDSLSVKGVSRMTEEEYIYYLQSALRCDKALLDQKNKAAADKGLSVWSIIGIVLLGILLLVAAGSAPPQNGDPSGGN